MKKILRYLQDQAIKASDQKYSGSAYLSPSTKEPQQRIRHHSPTEYKETRNRTMHHQSRSDWPARGLSTTTTVVDGGGGGGGGGTRTSDEVSMISRNVTRHQYGSDNILQSYDVYIPDHVGADDQGEKDGEEKKYWILFVHGGYFRDTNVTSTSFFPALSKIVSSSSSVAGYASINYRLSPHPNDPQDPTKTSTYELRNAQWPEHIHDVLGAIAHLQNKHGFGNRYLLAGHSVGATMALLSTLSESLYSSSSSVTKIATPLAVLGVSGIYDFPSLHDKFPSYVALTRNAKISSAEDDEGASPARYALEQYERVWAASVPGGKVGVVLAHSRDDGLVDWGQVEIMKNVLTPDPQISEEKVQSETKVQVRLLEIYGQHSQIWKDGTELARAIGEGVEMIKRLDSSL